MSTRRFEREEPPPRSKCISCLCFSWKVFTCVFSHVTLITLVVAYCVAGAFLFEHLEAPNERVVKDGIKSIRQNTTEMLWEQTVKMELLHQDNWTAQAIKHLQDFETRILKEMKEKGWDGWETDENKTQWTFTGSLFYSIIVITTIGYGHIAPKTIPGKISTIFYAILGIPLMLLCLSNIGDIMASSFRFLYWRVCCYVCTREPKKNRKRQIMRRETYRQQQQLALQDRPTRFPSRMPGQTSIRRSMKTSQRSADSGFDQRYDTGMSHAYSDMDCRNIGMNGGNMMEQQLYFEEREKARVNSFQRGSRGPQPGPPSPRYGPQGPLPRDPRNSYRGDRNTVDRERVPKFTEPDGYEEDDDIEEPVVHMSRRDRMREREMEPPTPQQNRHLMRHSEDRQMGGSPRYQRAGVSSRVQSLDRRMMRRDPVIIDFEQEPPCKAPIYANKYAMEDQEERRGGPRRPNYRSQSMPRQQSRFGDRLVPPNRGGGGGGGDNRSLYNESSYEMQSKGRKRERPVPSPSPRIMSPMGFAVHRQARHIASVMDENSLYGDDYDGYNGDQSYIKPVPIWLCVFLVIGYIIGGAFLFKAWEKWEFLDAAYFCFITLTTIGFGDFVPAQGEKKDPQESIALCSLYLLFGIALLAMSFNLVQEEVISKVKSIAKRLGILKDDEIED